MARTSAFPRPYWIREVTVSLKFSCGCSTRPGLPLLNSEVVHAGVVRECSKHGDQLVVRVTQRLVGDMRVPTAAEQTAHKEWINP